MPELPDVDVYVACLDRRIVGRRLENLRIASPFLLRTVSPPPTTTVGRVVAGTRRLGKRVVLALDGSLFLVIHLMIAGRLRWRERAAPIPRKRGLAALDFENGTVLLTEEGSKKRASLHVVDGETALQAHHDRGGLEPLTATLDSFRAALRLESHTLKRALTDPRLFSGIGNAYSDEILHAARLSPLALTRRLTDEEVARLHRATIETLSMWIEKLRQDVGDGFPEKVTAFRTGMAVTDGIASRAPSAPHRSSASCTRATR